MKKVCKIRIYPNQTQIKIINYTINTCRAIKNKHLEVNINEYKKGNPYISGYDFSKIINKLKKENEEYKFYASISSKALKDAIMISDKRFKKFFDKKGGFPKFISKKRVIRESYFFIKDHIHFNTSKKNIIKLPILGYIRITERNYLPDESTISSGRIIKENNKYYASFIYEYIPIKDKYYNKIHIGIDLGIKNYITLYDNKDNILQEESFIHNRKYKRIKDKIEKLQGVISHKVEINYGKLLNTYLDKHNGEYPSEEYKNKLKGESYNTSQIRSLKKKIKSLYIKLVNIRKDFIHKLCYRLTARTKPLSITIESLSITDMVSTENKDGHHNLHRLINESSFSYFKQVLIQKCFEYFIELRIANTYYPSSKICSSCGHKKKDLKLSDRIYICNYCGLEIDRDINAAKNLCFLKKYDILVSK